MTPKITPGRRLIAAMQDELDQVNEDTGKNLEFDAREAEAVQIAADCADRGAELAEVYGEELAGQRRPATLAKLASEIRGQQNLKLAALAKISFDTDRISQVRRQAARSRWGVNGVRGA